jgi:hypothetical protein
MFRALAAMLVVVALPAAAVLNMNEGLWETTLASDGRTQSAGVKCYTRDDIAEMEQLLQGKSTRVDGVCRYSDFTQSGDTIHYTMTCRWGNDDQVSAVEAIYRGDTADGSIRLGGVTVSASSRRIGPCAQSSFVR